MADQDQGAIVADKCPLELLDARDVEMIGRFIQQKQLGRGRRAHDARQAGSKSFATAQRSSRPKRVGTAKREAG